MLENWSDPIAAGTTVVVASGLAARQWEAHLADPPTAGGRHVWLSPPVAAYRPWTASLWLEAGGTDTASLLTPLQSDALWRHIIAESPEADRLIGTRSPAAWAADAWRRLLSWRLDGGVLAGRRDEPDATALAGWARAYEARLRAHDWLDPAQLDDVVSAAVMAGRLPGRRPDGRDPQRVLLDVHETTPAQERLLGALADADWAVEPYAAGALENRVARVSCADPQDELEAALAWAAGVLDREPAARVAVVLPEARARLRELERALAGLKAAAGRAYPWACSAAHPDAASPAIGAALTAVELLTPQGRFATFSRWLRSSFFADTDPQSMSARAMLEARLRDHVCSRPAFLEAYGRAGLAAELRRHAPPVAQRIDDALRELEPVGETRTPARWAQLWQRALTRLGWTPGAGEGAEALMRRWESALAELASLGPVLGAVHAGSAFSELETILARPAPRPLPLAGIHVLERADQLGPGYAGAWITGVTQRRWPPPTHANPLLPRGLRLEHGMPGGSPRETLARCRATLRHAQVRTPELVLSWPQREDDAVCRPSALIGGVPEARVDELAARRPPRRARVSAARGRETLCDPAPPLDGKRITGGAATLSLQARCPLRAFGERRLGARLLPTLGSGLPAASRGIAAHRALQLLLEQRPTQSQLAAQTEAQRRARIERCVEQALGEVLGPARMALRAIFDLECSYLAECLCRAVEADLQRAPFEVIAVETARAVELGAYRVEARIDRIDRLEDGALALLDYKTGAGPPASGTWFEPPSTAREPAADERDAGRPVDAQIPLYALAVGEAVSAVALVLLRRDRARFRGVWSGDAFPGRPAKLPGERSWATQLELWRRQLETLAAELAAGDVRLRLDTLESALGAYAPLSRVHEQLALQRGWLSPWPAP